MTTIVFDDDFNPPRYTRAGTVAVYPETPCTFRAVVESGSAVRGRVLLLQGTEQTVIATGAWSDGPKYELTIDEAPDPLHPLVVTVETEGDAWTISRAVYVGNPPDITEPRWVAVNAQDMNDDKMSVQGIGYVWWPGDKPQDSATPYKAIPGGSWTYDADPADFYTQCMAIPQAGDYYPEFIEHPSGHIGASFGYQQYYDWSAFHPQGFRTLLFRDGPRNIGSVGHPAGGFVDDDGALIAVSAPGRVFRIDVHGNVTTLAGWRIKPSAPGPSKEHDFPSSHFEHIGTIKQGGKLGHIWDVQRDPNDVNSLYIADVDGHCIRRLDRSTGDLSVFAGSVKGEAGKIDATGNEARFHKPRGIAFRDGFMYVGDAVNHAIRRIDMSTREVDTVVESAEKPHPSQHGGYKSAREWALDGAFGEAKFMHPQHVRFTSDGCLLTPMHHQGQLIEFDLENGRTRTLVEKLPVSDFWYEQHRTWLTLDVDDGSTGPVDTIYYNGWEHRSDRMYDREGNLVGPFRKVTFGSGKPGRIMHHTLSKYETGFDTITRNHEKIGYSQCTVVGQGAIWWGGVSGSGLFRIVPNPGVETTDHEQYNRGRDVWLHSPDPLRPSLSLLHGPRGVNGHGLETIDDLGRMNSDEFKTWLADKGRDDLTADDIDDLFYFIQNDSITARGLDDPEAAILPDESIPEPPEDDEPEPEPEPEEHPALQHIRDAEASLKKAKEQF